MKPLPSAAARALDQSENINSADKSLLEVVGHDVRGDFLGRNNRSEKQREAELKLILSSNFKGWNLSENLIAEKNLKAFPWEFGYSLGVARPLSLAASPNPCTLCRENFILGAELYGGLGDRYSFGLHSWSRLPEQQRWQIVAYLKSLQ